MYVCVYVKVMNSTVIKNLNSRRRRKGKHPPPPERGSAVAAHTTCYEQKTKMMGLKVMNDRFIGSMHVNSLC